MACPVCTVVRNVWDRFAAQRARRAAREARAVPTSSAGPQGLRTRPRDLGKWTGGPL